MLNEFLFPKPEEDDMNVIWFQQDGATCHTANVIIDLLRTVFENRIISLNSDVNWPPRSCYIILYNVFNNNITENIFFFFQKSAILVSKVSRLDDFTVTAQVPALQVCLYRNLLLSRPACQALNVFHDKILHGN